MDLSSYIFIDQHAHPLVREQMEIDGYSFRQCFTESRFRAFIIDFVPESLHYTHLLNELQEVTATESEGEFLSWRSHQDRTEYVRALLDTMYFGGIIIDYGFSVPDAIPMAEMAAIIGRPVFCCRRIENVLEKVIVETETFEELEENFKQRLTGDGEGGTGCPTAFKSIMGYRGGLQLDITSAQEAKADYQAVKELFSRPDQRRISRRPLYHYFLMEAFKLAGEIDVPVQIHTGLGDDDADLLSVNPALMQPLFRMPALKRTKFVLLHCYPYVREAALMAALYPNVYFDLSLAINLISAQARQMILEALSTAPSTKLLAGTDGHTCVEAIWYGAFCWKQNLGQVLGELIARSYLTTDQAQQVAANVLHGNAIRLYSLEGLI